MVEQHVPERTRRSRTAQPDHQVRGPTGRDPQHHDEDRRSTAATRRGPSGRTGSPATRPTRAAAAPRCLAGGSRNGPIRAWRPASSSRFCVQVRREEDHDEDLAELGRLEPERSDLHPQPRAVDRLARCPGRSAAAAARRRAARSCTCTRRACRWSRTTISVAANATEPDDDPRGLLGREAADEPEDHREAEPDEDAGRREQRRVGASGRTGGSRANAAT